MKWRSLLVSTETTGSVQTREMVTGDRPTNVISPASIGLSLAESNSILAAMQTELVQALGFKSMSTARQIICGYEIFAMIRKGQVKRIPANDIGAQQTLIASLFAIAA